MNLENLEFKTAILNVPETVTPLKFQEWLQHESARIQQNCIASSFTIIKLFLPFRIRLAYTHEQLGGLLQAIPNKHPNIHWIDVVQVDQSPDNDALAFIQEKEQKCTEALTKAMEEFVRVRKDH